MKIESINISNILSFPFVEDISKSEKITLEDGLNIIIGENGAGKSTALEVVNFLFKRVIYKRYNVNQDLYQKKSALNSSERKQILAPVNQNSFNGFRLEPNWDSEGAAQKIRISLRLDEIDIKNIDNIRDNFSKINQFGSQYAVQTIPYSENYGDVYCLDIDLNRSGNVFSVNLNGSNDDFGYRYLTEYNYFKNIIYLYNMNNPDDLIDPLYESFTLISSYRNYHAFQPSITLRDKHPAHQIQEIISQDYARSLNTSDKNEPSIFGLVRLRVAEKHFDLVSGPLSNEQSEKEANDLPFVKGINKHLKIVNLECKIRLVDQRTWAYAFEFFDIRRSRPIPDINSLSAGQKAIIHLVFEAYGRGSLKGGVVIIDEPEIHLHYQFQHEYLQVIKNLNKEQSCQYILVTHSEALINSNTISSVRRFSLSGEGHTNIYSPSLSTDEKNLIKILDNTRSTNAFFAKKVLLVEGDTDRYFFRAVIQHIYPEKDQEIAVLHMGGKGGYREWKKLFSDFGLSVSFVADFDFVVDQYFPNEKGVSLKTEQSIFDFKNRNSSWEDKIEDGYQHGIFILKHGDLEAYLGIDKGLSQTIQFSQCELPSFLNSTSSVKSEEIKWVVSKIVN